MSGGSLSYLYCKDASEMLDQNNINELAYAEDQLLRLGYEDIARDVRRLIEYCHTAYNRISVLKEQLDDVLHAIEWWISADHGKDTLKEHLEKYRNE